MGGLPTTSPFAGALVSGAVKQAQYKAAPNTVVPQVITPFNPPVSTNKATSVSQGNDWHAPMLAPGQNQDGSYGTPNPTTTPSGTSTSTAAAPDPYAAFGGIDRYNQLVSDMAAAKGVAYSSIGSRQDQSANDYSSSIKDYLDQKRAGQSDIDNESVNNELAKSQGAHSIMDMISHGIHSSAVRLAQGNAGSSSAAEQLAEAWGINGRQQMAGVNNQYEIGKNNIGNDQHKFDSANDTSMRHINESKSTIVNSIIDDATQKLSELNYRASYANLPDRIDIEAEKARIRNEAMGKLQNYDASLSNGNSGIAPMGGDAVRGKAAELATAGKAATTPFNIPSVIPVNQPSAASAGSTPFTTFPVPSKKNS